MSQWYYALGDQRNGPVETAVLQQMLSTGSVRYQDLVWREGMGDWAAAGSIPELRGDGPAPGYPQGQASQVPYQPLNYMQPVANHKSLATAALVLTCVGVFCFGPILAPTGIIMGIIARKNMKRDQVFEGSGMALAAIIVGSVLVCLYAVAVLFIFATARIK
jgi:hypothetical protein